MSFSRFASCLTFVLILSACGTAEKPPVDPGKISELQAQAPRPPGYSVRHGGEKPTPFADEESGRTVYFPFDGATIDDDGLEILRQNAQKLKENPRLVVLLVGHTDNLGSAAYNLAVADKRTEAVSDRLRSFGVPRNQIRRVSVGSEQSSKLRCDGEACRRSMRRVELIYEWR